MVVRGGNQALNVNFPGTTIDYSGGTADIALTVHGSDWYWAVTAVMAASTFTFMGLSHSKPREQRIFHYLTAAITMVASIAYFSMASGLGWAPIDVEFKRNKAVVAGNAREIFYVRYIDWFITTPLLLMDLLLTAAIPWPTIVFTIMMDWVMIITGLAGALLYSSYKWGYFSFGCAALFYIAYVLTWEARKNAQLVGSDVGKVYLMCGSWTIFLWFLYPIAWGLCEGGNVISPDSEAIFYGILDICAKPLFGALLLYGHRNIDIERLGMNIRRYGVPFAGVPQKGNKEHNGGENDYGVPVNGTDAARTVTNGESAA